MTRNYSSTALRHQVAQVLLLAVLLVSTSVLAQENAPDPLMISRTDRLKVFEEVWQTVNKHFFDPDFNGVNWAQVREQYRSQVEAADNKNQLNEALQKMLNELRSSHLEITVVVKLKKKAVEQGLARKVNRKESLSFDSGMKYERIDGKWVVSAIAEGSGAQAAGVQRGWEVTHWNGESAQSDLPFTCELNQQVKVRFVDSRGEEKRLALTCKLYSEPPSPPERITRRLENGTMYLRFTEFSPGTESWLTDQMIQAQTAPAIVMDLRDNQGGTVAVLEKCLAPFFDAPMVLGEFRERNGKQPQLKTKGQSNKAYRGRVIVLINEKTMSAGEIFAAALQETGRAVVVGRKSSGDVLGGMSYGLSQGFRVKIPVWDYHTAKGVRLEKRGVIPDEQVTLTLKDFLEHRDLDLERAQTLLQKK
ncbi:MAG: hypothetical protein JNK38_19055 [Acidobacteria bacterium]|nr:hypothetical protein [Acidobacteriota bacterium]